MEKEKNDAKLPPENSEIIKYVYLVNTEKKYNNIRQEIGYLEKKFPGYEILSDIDPDNKDPDDKIYKGESFYKIINAEREGKKISLVIVHKKRLCEHEYKLLRSLVKRTNGDFIIFDINIINLNDKI